MLNEHALPESRTNIEKLSDYPDGEEILVFGVGTMDGKYGEQPFFTLLNGTRLMLPKRYLNYVQELMEDPDAIEELAEGLAIKKESYEYKADCFTPTFKYI